MRGQGFLVVEADDGYIAGNRQVQLGGGLVGAPRGAVIRAEDGRRRVVVRHQVHGVGKSVQLIAAAEAHQFRADGQSGFGHGFRIAVIASDGGGKFALERFDVDHRHPLMPRVEKASGGGVAAQFLIRRNAGKSQLAILRVQHNRRDCREGLGYVESPVVHASVDNASHLVRQHGVQRGCLQGFVATRVHGEQEEAVLPGALLCPLDDLSCERGGGNGVAQEADDARNAVPESLGVGVGAVAKLLHGIHHALPGFVREAGTGSGVQYQGNCCLGNAGGCRYVVHGGT
ncbi:hypothetical protein D9M72_442960 [compost metagenome]